MANQVLVETSARHVHVTQEDLETLFGKGMNSPSRNRCLSPGNSPVTNASMSWGRKRR